MAERIVCKNCNTNVKYTPQQVRCDSDSGCSVYNVDGEYEGIRRAYYIYCPRCEEKIIVGHRFYEKINW